MALFCSAIIVVMNIEYFSGQQMHLIVNSVLMLFSFFFLEKNSFLFIHATDGQEWSTFMMKLLEAQPFNIPCHSVSYQDVNEKLIQKCSVLVLVFTPEMESRISSLNFDLLQPDSMHSCLVECNGHVNETDMPTWKTKFTQLPTVESYRAVLSGLIDLYELVTGNVEYFDADIDDVFIIDVKPTILYPVSLLHFYLL